MTKLKRHHPSLVGNLLGLQLFRVWRHNRRLRRQRDPSHGEPSELAATLRRDGIVVLPDFLPAADFDRVRHEFESAWKQDFFESRSKEATSVLRHDLDVAAHGACCPTIVEHFADNPVVRSILSGALGREFPERGEVRGRRYARSSDPAPSEKMYGIEYLHADAHVPAYKVFYFLSDTDERNGALVYAPGSNRMGLARLGFEYRTSVRTSWAFRRKQAYRVLPLGMLVSPTAGERRRMGIREEHQRVKGNTLVIFDTRGFHRQGQLDDGRTRDHVNVEYSHVTRGS